MIKDRRRQRRTEVEQVLLQHPDIVQAFVVGIPEIVAAPVELRGRVPTDPLARRDLPRKPRRRGWRPRELCRRAKSKPRRYLVAYQPLRQKATIAAVFPGVSSQRCEKFPAATSALHGQTRQWS